MAIGWSFKKTRLAERANHAGRDLAQPFKDLGNSFRSLGVSAGFYTKAVDAFAEISANGKAGEGAGERCSFRDVLLKVLLGMSGGAAKGVKQSLEKSENKYDSITVDNTILDLEAQIEAVKKLKDTDKKSDVGTYATAYGNALKGKLKNFDGSPYKPDKDKLQKTLEEVAEDKSTSGKSPKDKKVNELERELSGKKKDKKDATKIRNAFKGAHEDLEEAMTLAEGFLKPFGKKTEAANKRFTDKSRKLEEVITSCKPKAGREEAEIKKIEEASKSANKAYRTLLTLQGAQVAGYRRITETLIDAWIDLHRLVEKHNNTDPVIGDRYQKVILLIRKENRTYFLKESIDEKQKIKSVSEDAGDKIADALDKETISKRGKKLALEKSDGK